jgi:hypothetical protein
MKPTKQQGIPRTELPDEINLRIGRIIVLWAYVEAILKATIYNLLGVDSREGRRAVREPRVRDTVMLIKDLLAFNKISVSGDLDKLAAALDELSSKRHSLAHGLWVDIEGITYLQVTSGSWRPEDSNEKVSRKVSPQGFMVPKEEMDDVLEAMSDMAGAVEGIGKQVVTALSASPRKSRLLHPIYDLHQARSLERLRRRRKPSS